ncbi:cysteine desulfurase family protein [Mesorhizobium sp. M0053]|uniref:cysteine desulfurase family protein n=1 Tax=Mesorhizobium sp. M0053 TaxID=2956864 RepID=UPI00333865B0
MSEAPIYLDYHSHAPIMPRVLERLIAAYGASDANPHSTHLHGASAHEAVEEARSQVAELLGSRGSEIVFTSGATESNNLALGGLAEHLWAKGKRRIVVSAIEHSSVIEKAKALVRLGWHLDIVPVVRGGQVDLAALADVADEMTGLVSIAWANHEIGVLQPMDEIARIVHAAGGLLHSDLAQIAGKLPISTSILDIASISAHKLGGPTGVGALHIARRLRSKLTPMLLGGGQEGGARSGTVAPPLCVAFGEACSIAHGEMGQESVRLRQLRDGMRDRLLALRGAALNGDQDARLPGNLNLRFSDVDGEALVLRLQDEVSISTGSACSSRTIEPSHVLLALGLSRQDAETSVRIGLGHGTTTGDVERAISAIEHAVASLRSTRRRA